MTPFLAAWERELPTLPELLLKEELPLKDDRLLLLP